MNTTLQGTPPKTTWSARFGRWSIRLVGLSFIAAAIGLTLARFDLIPKLAGFGALVIGALIALIGLIAGLAMLVGARRGGVPGKGKVLLAVVCAAFYVGFIASRPLVAGSAPAIHDVTTDLANPPQFKVLQLRPDNLVGVETEENWRRIHAAAYADLGPVTIAQPAAQVTARALQLAKDSGWEIAASDPALGHIEATSSVSFIRFHDDVVIRVTPSADGKSSRVDMRSVSRVGVGDLGVNAQRIKAFLAALRAS